MSRVRRRPRWWARLYIPLVLAASALLPSAAAAQTKTASADPTIITDSAHAVTAACAILESLRPPPERARCLVASYRETSAEFVVRIREQALPDTSPTSFPNSEVRLKKSGAEVTVTREPEL